MADVYECWTMRDGTKIKLKNMSESHIQNCIAMVTKTAKRHKERGEMVDALFGYESEGAVAVASDLFANAVICGEWKRRLNDELNRRGLKPTESPTMNNDRPELRKMHSNIPEELMVANALKTAGLDFVKALASQGGK